MNAFFCPKGDRRLNVETGALRPRLPALWLWLLASAPALLVGADGRGTAAESAPVPEPKVVVVDADGKGDFTSVRKALADAKDGTTVRVKPGHYKEDELAVSHDVTIEGDGAPGGVVLEMSAAGIRSTAEQAVFRGLTVRTQVGSALLVEKGGAVVEDCRFTTESPSKDGAALVSVTTDGKVQFVRTRASGNPNGCGFQIAGKGEVTLEDCDILDNASHNVYVGEQAHVTLKQCRVLAAQLDGIRVNGNAEVVVKDCDLTANGGNGFQNEEQSRAELHQCRVRRNLGTGIALRGRGGNVLDGCEVTGNGGNGASIGPGK